MEYNNVKPIINLNKWCIHSYYTLNPYAPDNSGRLLFSGVDLKTRLAEIYIASKDGEIQDKFGADTVSENFFHTGFWQSWSPDSKYIYYQQGSLKEPIIARREIATGKIVKISGSTEGISPTGEPIISGYLGMLYAAGYGDKKYKPKAAPVPFQERGKHGIFSFSFDTEAPKLLISVDDVFKNHFDREKIEYWDKKVKAIYGENDGLTLMCYCVRWNPLGDKCLFYFGNHTASTIRNEPKIGYVVTVDKDFKHYNIAVDMSFGKPGLHWGWHPDGKRLIGYGVDPENIEKMCLCMVNYDGTGYTKISDNRLGGHPSISPVDYNLLVTDGKFNPGDGDMLGQVVFIDVSTGKEINNYIFGRKNTKEHIYERNEHWLCHHPVFAHDGSKVLVNTLSGENAQLMEIKLR